MRRSRAGEAEKPRSIQQKSMHRKRDQEVSRHSAEVGIPQVRRSQEPSDEDEYPQNSGACVDGHRAALRTTTTPVVLKASADQSPADEKTEQLSAKNSGEQKIHEMRAKSFPEARRTRGRVLTSTASRRRLERRMQHCADER